MASNEERVKIASTNLKRHCLVRHKRFMDVAIRLILDPPLPSQRLRIEGFWINLATCRSFNIGDTPFGSLGKRHLQLSPKDLKDWQVYAGEDILKEPMWDKMSKSYRNAAWEPVKAENLWAENLVLEV